MKSKEEILKRAIILLAFSDRCALEKKIIDGVSRSLNEREMQRQAIVNWLVHMGYYDSVSEKEKQVFNRAITTKTNVDILSLQNDYECLEPMLWSLGLVSELSSYDKFVLRDFHPLLKFGKKHSIESLLESCSMVSDAQINDYRALSMLWYWRCLECRNGLSRKPDIKKAIYDIFGEKYIQLLHTYNQFDNVVNDFIIMGKKVIELNDEEIDILSIISERRFYAFEWLSTDAELKVFESMLKSDGFLDEIDFNIEKNKKEV